MTTPWRSTFDLSPQRRDLLERLRHAQAQGSAGADRIPRTNRDEPLPLSFAQQRLWFLEQLQPGTDTYNLPGAVRLHGSLDRAALQQALTAMATRHESLRTTISTRDGQPVQVVAPAGAVSLPLVDLSGLPPAARESEVRRMAREESRRPFDLGRGPLHRWLLLSLQRDEHVLVSTTHHIISDGWSRGVLTRELATLYGAFRSGQTPSLPELPVQYGDFAAWQRARMSGERGSLSLSYWRQQLEGAAVLHLPTDRTRPSEPTSAGASAFRALPVSLAARLETLGRSEGATLFMTLLAAFQVLLHRYTGQQDVVVGSPIANRNRAEIEGLVGFFVNTLVLRTEVSPRSSFREILGRVRETALGAYEHQDLPFEKLVEELQPERSLSQSPLFQVTFALQNTPVERAALDELALAPVEMEVSTTRFDLELYVRESAGGLGAIAIYNTALFDAATVDRWLSHYETLLEGIAADPDRSVQDLPLLTRAEERLALVEWNATRREHAGLGVVESFEEQAERDPGAVAVVSGVEELSYGELDRRANQVAHYLLARGAGPETRVGVCLERSVEMVVALLGVLKAGAAYVPLDPGQSGERLSFMVRDAELRVLLTRERWLGVLPEDGVPLTCLDRDGREISEESELRPERRADPEGLAYVIYTSGSTGQPKGVEIPHRGLLNLVRWHQRVYDVTSRDRATQVASPAFDASVWELWPYLSAGARVFIPDEETRVSPRELTSYLSREGITLCFLPTPLAEAALSEPWPVGELRALLTGGDKLHRLGDVGPTFPVVNHYGPTETSVVATWGEVLVGVSGDLDPSIGRPIDNTRVYVLDRGMRPVPVGIAGELFIGGEGLARGYLKRPELTAEKFVPDPFGEEPGGRLYRTGDLVRHRPNGELEFLGRLDQQVKVRGYRIELGEIESVLGQGPGVREVAVVVREDGPGERRLVAYVVSGPGALAPSELRGWAKGRLPDYMVPSSIVVLEALPLTAHGKVDRLRLASWGEAGEEPEAAFEEGRTAAERTLARIWEEVLRVERVGIRDNFFELGGDSILSIQVVSRARDAGLRLTLKQMFQQQTIAELAAVAGTAAEVEAEQGLVTGEVPLTPIQRWFFEQDLEDPHHFNQAMLLEPKQELDAGFVEKAVAHLQEHHDALRTRFRRAGGTWRQEVVAEAPAPFEVLDLGAQADREPSTAIREAAERVQRSLDPESGPLWQVVLFGLGRGQCRLLIVIHHLVVDGVSWRILLEDLQAAYEQARRGEPLRLSPKTTSFQEWARKLVAHAASTGPEEREHWLSVASGCQPLPVEGSAAENTVASTATVSMEMDAEETRALLQDVPAAYRTRVTEVLLAGVLDALCPWTGRDRLLIDLEGHGREDVLEGVDVSRTVGWFTSVFPVRLERVGSDPGERLVSVKEQLRRVPGHGLGYGLQRYLGDTSEGGLRGRPSADVSFNYLGQFDQVLGEASFFGLARESAGRTRSPRGRRSHLVEISGAVTGGRLRLAWTFSENVHRRATIEGLAAAVGAALRATIEHCRRPGAGGYSPSDFPLARLSQRELDRVVAASREVDDVYPLSPTQQGLLFHALLSPEAGNYVEQLILLFEGGLKPDALREAWQRVLDRHGVLRTRFSWEGLSEPVQVVERRAELPWEEHDWSGIEDGEQRLRLEALLEADREAGFEMARAPLMRLTVIRHGESSHRMIWSFHHILLDGWCLPLLLKEVLSLHQGVSRGGDVELEQVRPYRDYIAWLSAQDVAKAEAHWRAELAGLRAPTPLGVDRRNPPPDTRREVGEERAFASAATTSALKALGRRHQITLGTIVQGAWAALLSRYSGERDVTFGVTASGRPAELPGVETMVGLFINTLPLRVSVPDDQPVVGWLKDLQARQVERRQYEHSPLAQVQKWCDVEPGRPMFDSLLAFENYPVEASREATGPIQVREVRFLERTNYPLTIAASPGPRLSIRMTYDRTRLDSGSVARMLGHLTNLLGDLSRRPDAAVGDLVLTAEAEERLALVEWNATRREHAGLGVVESFEEQAERDPGAVAVVSGVEELSYGELDRRANQVAHYLLARGAGPETRVGVCLERSVEMVVALLGVLKAGAAYVPLDPGQSGERLSFMVRDAELRVLLTRERWLGVLPEDGVPLTCLDRDGREISEESELRPERRADPEGLAYVIYTSGSTGQPKGVEIPHRGLLNLVRWHQRVYDVTSRDRATQVASPAFDASVWELWPYLSAGARVFIPDEETRVSPRELTSYLSREGITLCFLPTPLAEAALSEPWPVGELRALLTGGDKLHRLGDVGPTFPVVNHYGPTETSVVATWGEVLVGVSGDLDPSIGRPIDNTRVYVLDRGMRPVPVGIAGELFIGGEGLARGYLKRPELTAEKFVPDPFGEEPGGRLYRTGDLVRHRPNGELEFLGRLDQQVKVRGYRIELGEIESVLGQGPGVREVAVVVREDGPGERRLVAYVVSGPGALAPSELRGWAKGRLPDYMVPSSIVVLEALPLTAHGKVDRLRLASWGEAGEEPEAAFEEGRTAAERTLARIWEEVLRVERVGIRDNFFELGGDSILSIQVVSRARDAGLRLTLKQMFQQQTIAELAAVAGTAAEVEAEQGLVTGEVPLTPIQRWFFEQDLEDPHHFNQAVLLELRRPIAPDRLERAVAELERHHDALRTRFAKTGGTWEQRCVEPCQAPLQQVDLGAIPAADRRAAIEATAEEAQRSLDLGQGPLWRAILMAAGEGQAPRLLVVVHHLVVDGVSWRVLLEDLQTLCEQLSRGQRPSLPRKTTSFKRWAERLLEHAKGPKTREEAEHWRQVADGGFDPLPVDKRGEGSRNTVATTRKVSVLLGEEATRSLLQEVPAAYRTQIGDVLLTAVLEAFHGWTGRDELFIELEGHGREDLFEGVDVSRTVGWFTSLYPVRLVRGSGGIGGALKAVKEQLRQVPRRGIAYGLLRHVEGADLRGAAEVAFNYLGQFDATPADGFFAAAGENPGRTRAPGQGRPHLLEVSGLVSGGQLRIDWSYSEAVHERATVEGLARRFEAALLALIEHCRSGVRGRTPSDFPLARLDAVALERVVGEGRDVEDVYPLTPMQEGMLFHSLLSPGSGLYFEQGRFDLSGRLERPAFRQAWERVVERHGALRTRFCWEDLERPLQVVERDVALPWDEEDWSELAPEEQDARFEEVLRADRERGFDPRTAPLMRLKLVILGAERHRLVWSFHHAILDGWCLPLLWREVLAVYRSLAGGPRVPLADVRPYQEYVAWLCHQDLGAVETYWRKELAGFRSPTPLGVDRASRPGSEQSPGEWGFALDEAATDALRSLGRRHGLTTNTLVLGAWAALLSRYSGEEDVLFGVTVSGRSPAVRGVEAMVGLFINTLPLRLRFRGEQPVLEWLKQLQAHQVEQGQYEHSPLAQVQKWSEVESGRALFESLLVFENYPLGAPGGPGGGLEIRWRPMLEVTNYPLVLAALPGRQLRLHVVYDRARFDHGAIVRLEGHLRQALDGLVGGIDGRLRDLRLMSDSERDRVLCSWNETKSEYPGGTIGELFEERARLHGDSAAVSFEGRSLSYGELDRRSNQLAHRLRRMGVCPGTKVGICLERSLDLVVGLLGIVKAGGAYVALDPGYPGERLSFLLQDAEVRVLLTQESVVGSLPPHGAQVLCLDRAREEISGEEETRVVSGACAEDLAYVTYTSGSTGSPKGVEVRHRGVMRLLFGVDYAEFGPREVFLQMAPVSFDASTLEVWGALLHGGRCVVYPERLATARELGEVIEREGVTTLWLTSSLYNSVLDESPGALRGVKQLLIGGEALSVGHVRRGLELLPGTRIVNGYGPTESTTFTCCYEVPRELGEGTASIPIGRPIGNTRVYVLDGEMEPVPVGVTGELYVGGDGLARGYLRRPDLTAEKFVPDPFGGEAGGRLYRTGDRVRHLADGNLEFLGRLDHQVKVRGFRIELGEVESVLGTHPGVKEAVAVVREDHPGEKRLVAYVVAGEREAGSRPAEGSTVASLRAFLQSRLPEHMVPAAFVIQDAIPLTPSGKVDRRSLPAPGASRPELARAFVEPRTPSEQAIAAIWRGVLRLERVGVHDNFFELGGHSLLIVQAHGRLAKRFPDRSVSLVDLFRHPTIAELSAWLDADPGSSSLQSTEGSAEKREAARERLGRRRGMREAQVGAEDADA